MHIAQYVLHMNTNVMYNKWSITIGQDHLIYKKKYSAVIRPQILITSKFF